jgi:hypothetical protein
MVRDARKLADFDLSSRGAIGHASSNRRAEMQNAPTRTARRGETIGLEDGAQRQAEGMPTPRNKP